MWMLIISVRCFFSYLPISLCVDVYVNSVISAVETVLCASFCIFWVQFFLLSTWKYACIKRTIARHSFGIFSKTRVHAVSLFYHKFVPRNRKTMNVLVYSKAWLCRNVEQNKWNDLVFCHLTKKCILRIDKFDFWIDNCRLEVRTIRNLLVRCHVKFISQNCPRETQKRAYR